jgi:hypothetical protein
MSAGSEGGMGGSRFLRAFSTALATARNFEAFFVSSLAISISFQVQAFEKCCSEVIPV